MTSLGVHLGALLAACGLGDADVLDGAAVTKASRLREGGLGNPLVTDVVLSSQEARPGALFACAKGSRSDGHDFVDEARRRGAVAVISERPVGTDVPQVIVPSVREVIGPVASAFWEWPSSAMKVVGVTGTNGKTTTCAILAAIFEAAGWHSAVIGTLSGERTTPEAPALQRLLSGLRDQGTKAVAMEVSSHALDQHRVGGTHFAAGVFTNLSQDHLDYHRDMESYFEAKASLFTREDTDVAVVNSSDPWGARLIERLRAASRAVVAYSTVEVRDVVLGQRSTSFSWGGEQLELKMGGRFNIANAVAASATARALGAGWDAVAAGLASVPQVRGRFEHVDEGQPFSVLVDFAHTPGALAELLMAARELAGTDPSRRTSPGPAAGKLILVFGAGGDRDRAKRPLMGLVASRLADVVIITSDNPRNEKPLAIIEEVASGVEGAAPLVDADRASAIAGAISIARPGDVVLIAGKGHETGQDFGSHIEPFDDLEVARSALRSRGRS